MTAARRLAGVAVAAACLATPALAQRDYSQVEVRTTRLADGVYMMTGAGGNLGLAVGEDAVFLVDDQYAPLTPKISEAIAKLTARPVRFVLNTHWHGDHTGGNENFGRAGALLVAHDNVRARMGSEQFIEFMRMKAPPSPAAALPVVTFSGAMTFHLNGEEIRVIHVPRAHTDGDAIVHFVKSDVIHMGDTFFNAMYPFIDASSGGTVDGTIAAVEKALGIAGERTRIIPGHGPLASTADLAAYRTMLLAVSGRIREMLRDGRKLEEITASGVTADFDARWGQGFIKGSKFAEMIAMGLIRAAP